MFSEPYFERIPDESLIAAEQGEKYNYLAATRGHNYAMIYTCNGINMTIQMGIINGDSINATWFNPRSGEKNAIAKFENKGILNFAPPGKISDGYDWVLILEGQQ